MSPLRVHRRNNLTETRLMMERISRKEIILAEVARFVTEAYEERLDGVDFYEVLYRLRAKKHVLGFGKKQQVREDFLLSSMVLGSDAAFCIDQQLVVRFKEEESEPRPRRKRNQRRA